MVWTRTTRGRSKRAAAKRKSASPPAKRAKEGKRLSDGSEKSRVDRIYEHVVKLSKLEDEGKRVAKWDELLGDVQKLIHLTKSEEDAVERLHVNTIDYDTFESLVDPLVFCMKYSFQRAVEGDYSDQKCASVCSSFVVLQEWFHNSSEQGDYESEYFDWCEDRASATRFVMALSTEN